jgi:starvation-inducible DNA-binding protein
MIMTKKLDVYLANLAVNFVKLHNLHWNVVGKTFKQVHEYLEEMYDEVFEKYDEFAEYQKMVGDYPRASMKEYLEIATIKEIESKDYNVAETYDIVLSDLKLMRDLAIEVRKEADENDEFNLVAMMEDEVASYSKKIWFVESMLKGR